MGEYINHPTMKKEEFLEQNGRKIATAYEADTPSELPVCLVDNGRFTAAGIAYDESEIDAFNDPSDGRQKQWYAVPSDLLTDFMSARARRAAGLD